MSARLQIKYLWLKKELSEDLHRLMQGILTQISDLVITLASFMVPQAIAFIQIYLPTLKSVLRLLISSVQPGLK